MTQITIILENVYQRNIPKEQRDGIYKNKGISQFFKKLQKIVLKVRDVNSGHQMSFKSEFHKEKS